MKVSNPKYTFKEVGLMEPETEWVSETVDGITYRMLKTDQDAVIKNRLQHGITPKTPENIFPNVRFVMKDTSSGKKLYFEIGPPNTFKP
jgi:hypothetical protein